MIRILFLSVIILKRTGSDNEDFRLLIGELLKELWSRHEKRRAFYDRHIIIETIEMK